MNKKIKVFIIAAVALLILFSLFFVFKSSNKPAGDGTQASDAPKPGTVEVKTKNGDGNIPVRDFNKDPAEVVTDTVVIKETPDFSITYFPKDQAFLVTLLSQPVAQARDKAEQE